MDFKITGLDDLTRTLDKMAKAADPQAMARQMRSSRCPDHGSAPTNVRVSGDRVTAEFCCDTARERAMKATTDHIFGPIR